VERQQGLSDLEPGRRARDAIWEEGLRHLAAFRSRKGHCRVPQSHVENGFRLGQWVTAQRTQRDSLSAEQCSRLDQLGFVWDPLETAWEHGFVHLRRYQARAGDCRVPYRHIEDDYPLGPWVVVQRSRKNELSADRRKRLDELGFVWDPGETVWQEGLSHLASYRLREGHADVPYLHKENGYPLGLWVSKQRLKKAELTGLQRRRLDDLTFVWETPERAWEKGFECLKAYRAREGDCRVPYLHKENGYPLGQWVLFQRAKRIGLSREQRARLSQIGFVWKVARGGRRRR
jgi:hypothetical protein